MSTIESAKQTASKFAVNDCLKDNQIVGIGSGTTIEFVIDYIAAQKVRNENLQIKCVPTSYQLDIAFDGADEVDANFNVIKGAGGCLLQEKIIASCASKLIIVVDERKWSKKLGMQWTKGIPIEVIPMAYKPIQNKIETFLGGKVCLRPALAKMGPVVTDNGNFLLDWKFDTRKDYDWNEVDISLLKIPGIVETGLFVNMTDRVYVSKFDGSVEKFCNKYDK